MKKHRTLIISIPIALLLLGAVAYQYTYVKQREGAALLREEVEAKENTLQKYVDLIAARPFLEKKVSLLEERRRRSGRNLVRGGTPSIAAASLLGRVKGQITSKGGRVSTERVLKPEQKGVFTRVAVTVNARVPDTAALVEAMKGIERGVPVMRIDSLDVRVQNLREPRELIVKLAVSALMEGNKP